MNNKIIAVILSLVLSGCFVYPGDIEKANRMCGDVKYVRSSIFSKEIIARCMDGSSITFESTEGK